MTNEQIIKECKERLNYEDMIRYLQNYAAAALAAYQANILPIDRWKSDRDLYLKALRYHKDSVVSYYGQYLYVDDVDVMPNTNGGLMVHFGKLSYDADTDTVLIEPFPLRIVKDPLAIQPIIYTYDESHLPQLKELAKEQTAKKQSKDQSTPRQRKAVYFTEDWIHEPFTGDINSKSDCSEYLSQYLDEAKMIADDAIAEFNSFIADKDWA